VDLFFQVWGGCFYLLNKVFLSISEGKKGDSQRKFKLAGWAVYMTGLPAIVLLFAGEHNWIAASVEAGGLPAMILGFYIVYKRKSPKPFYDKATSIIIYLSIAAGVLYSLYDYSGITSLTQILEITTIIGYLLGSYLLAKNNLNGWLFFMMMNLSVVFLMFIQKKYFITGQQIISLCFVIFGYVSALKTRKKEIMNH